MNTLETNFNKLVISTNMNTSVKKSWALMSIEEEEEEEREKSLENQAQIKKQAQKRRELFKKGLYILEDGEILE